VLVTTSRLAFFVGTIVLFVLFVILFARSGGSMKTLQFKRTLAFALLLLGITGASQVSFQAELDDTTFKRISSDTPYNRSSLDLRVVYWNVGMEAFRSAPLTGVGADNYITIYKEGREAYSQRNPDNQLLDINEDII